jgi:hypothetical protein
VARNILVVSLPFFLLFSGCSHTSQLPQQETALTSEPEYSVTILIHGDSDYLYHSREGQPIQADKHALQMSRKLAEYGTNGEFIIIHQQPKKRFLRLIPRRSSEIYHYRNGELVQQLSYRNESDEEPFLETESKLYDQLLAGHSHEYEQRHFLYFGHEIPLRGGHGYHQSRPEITVHTKTFAKGLKRFLPEKHDRFDLITLSTCSNGTPQMALSLSALTEFLLASPQNLHLSYIDIGGLSLLETSPDSSPEKVALTLAEKTYERLSESIQTVITLSVYDLRITSGYLTHLFKESELYISESKPDLFRENIDCGTLPFFDESVFGNGVTTFFRAPRFGPQSSKQTHSGWGCKPVRY